MTIKIRKAKGSDYEGIDNLLGNIYVKIKSKDFTKNKFVSFLKKNKSYCYVAEAKGKIIGNIFGSDDGAFTGYIQKLAVDKEYRRRGIAVKLIKIVIKEFNKNRIRIKYAHVRKDNKSSLELFKSLGFELRDSHHLADLGY